jgi:hypothetical protein
VKEGDVYERVSKTLSVIFGPSIVISAFSQSLWLAKRFIWNAWMDIIVTLLSSESVLL